jgi:hypothetical protein
VNNGTEPTGRRIVISKRLRAGQTWEMIAEEREAEFLRLVEQNHRWSYAILGLGLHKGMLAPHSRRAYTVDRHGISCTIRPLFFDDNPHKLDTRSGLHSITFRAHAADDQLAQRMADAVFAGLAIHEHPLRSEPPSVLRFPSRLVGKRRACSRDVLVAWYAVTSGSHILDVMHTQERIGATTWVSPEIVAEVWRVLPALLTIGLFEGSQFLCASLTDFSFPGDVATEYLGEPGRKPASFFEQVRVEGAVMNAFKAIEAVIGDPPKNEAKLHHKLAIIGVDPQEQVGYPDETFRPLGCPRFDGQS